MKRILMFLGRNAFPLAGIIFMVIGTLTDLFDMSSLSGWLICIFIYFIFIYECINNVIDDMNRMDKFRSNMQDDMNAIIKDLNNKVCELEKRLNDKN